MSSAIFISVSDPGEQRVKVQVADPNDESILIIVNDALLGGSGTGSGGSTIVFEGIVGGETVLSGTPNPLTGFVAGSDLITLQDFIGVRVELNRGGQDSPSIGPFAAYTKDLNSDSILLVSELEEGEYIKIKTIPS